MVNFYTKIIQNNLTLNSEKESVEIYIGQSGGKQIGEDISKAQTEVIIISPYMDQNKIKDLIHLKEKGITVKIAFANLKEKEEGGILRSLIVQNCCKEEKTEKDIAKKVYRNNFGIIGFGIFTLVSFSPVLFKLTHIPWAILSFIGSISFLIIPLLFARNKKIKKTKILYYSYTQRFPFIYFNRTNWDNKDIFMHSKIYIIDKKIAYLGSLNYTNNGFTSNFETRIRIVSSKKVEELAEFADSIFANTTAFRGHRIDWLGKKVYKEADY